MGRFLFKAAIISILCLLAYLLFRFVFNLIKEDNLDGRSNLFSQMVEETIKTDNYSAEISDLTIEHNQTRGDEYGLYVYSTQTWRNLKGVTCYSTLRFFDDNGTPLSGKQFKDEYGNLCITGEIVPKGKKVDNDQRIFVPYTEFDIPNSGTVHFLCDIVLYVVNEEGQMIELAYSKPFRFHLSYQD